MGSNIFQKTITKCIIPNSVTSIGELAFSFCTSLKEITIHNNVTSIGYWAFLACESLKEITIPNNVTSIGNEAFCYGKSLKEIVFKGKTLEEVKQMKYYPFGIEDKNVFKFG